MARHLNTEERIKIETLLDAGKSVDEIALYLDRHRSTIYRELNRPGICSQQYNAALYHQQARQNMGRHLEVGPSEETILFVNRKILEEQWSPEQISSWLALHGYETVSHTWIYQYMAKDKADGGELHNHMRRGNYSKGHKEYKGHIHNRVSIEQRPEIVDTRMRLGDYEIDLIVGPKNKGAILSIIERSSRECILEKLENKTSASVCSKTIEAFLTRASNAYTITSDNGTEFTDHQTISEKLAIDYYFAHPYASYERGSIENLNGLVRQYIPKGTDFTNIQNEELKVIQDKLNNRPRKVLGFLTPIEYTKNYYNTDNKLDQSHLNL
jgi:transposase, IS30 family